MGGHSHYANIKHKKALADSKMVHPLHQLSFDQSVDALPADQDPLSDRYARFAGYVTRELTQRLIDRLQHPPPPVIDYFLQARYEPAHLGAVRVAPRARAKDRAEVLVTLGDAPPLALVLVVEGGAWKIVQVRRAPEPESSFQQPAI